MQRFILFFLRLALALRYRIRVEGLNKLKHDKSVMFLANHPAEVDPLILMTRLWKRFRVHPITADFVFHIPLIRWAVTKIGAISYSWI